MPVDPTKLDRLVNTLVELFEDAESALVALITRNLDKGMDSPSWVPGKYGSIRAIRQGVTAISRTLTQETGTRLRDIVAQAYRSGWRSVLSELPAEMRRDIEQRDIDTANLTAMEALANAVHEDIGATHSNILRDVLDTYRAVQAAAAGRVLTGVQTRIEASQAAWTRLAREGIMHFTDRSGRRWKTSSYVEMAARTVTQRAAVQGHTDRLTDIGQDLVIVSDAPEECRLCRPWEQKVLRISPGPTGGIRAEHAITRARMTVHVAGTLEEARAAGLFHPNCRHSVAIYLPGITKRKTNTADPKGDKARQRQRALERRIRRARTDEASAMTPEAKTAARQAVRKAQAAMRQHLEQHPDLRRLRYREQIGGGNIPKAGARHEDVAALITP